ncbi:MAG: FprA family A-type flavoprotein [Candidatus Nezhaarchaeota archaeon]|nr:FprA family A-type flavoprotein [Candidatus Nezhaarchaeota archaeon]
MADGVYWVGSRDWSRRLFDSLIPLPKGTSYNSYLIVGDGGEALIDTVNPGFELELEEKLRGLTDPGGISYIVMNHAEPDHAGAIPHMLKIASKAKLVTTSQGASMAQALYRVQPDRVMVVRDGEAVNLGGKTLRFIEAPMLHWPETMFTYLEEEGILFSCDFFGSHLAGGLYSDEVEDLLVHARRYWGEIMMPFRAMAQRALQRVEKLDVRLIAPSHGPVHRHPKQILEAYRRWAGGETRRKVTVVYVSMWGSTELMVKRAVETLEAENVEVAVHNLEVADVGEAVADLVDSRAIVLGAPTVLGGAHPIAFHIAHLVGSLRPPAKFALLLGSYGWGGGAVKQLGKTLEGLKLEVVGSVEVKGSPTAEDLKRVAEAAEALAEKVRREA